MAERKQQPPKDERPWLIRFVTHRQVQQSIGQFVVVILSGLAVIGHIPTFEEVYPHIVQGLLAAVGIWGFSKVPTAQPKK